MVTALQSNYGIQQMTKRLDKEQDGVAVNVKYTATESDLVSFFDKKVKSFTGDYVDLWSTTENMFLTACGLRNNYDGYFHKVWMNFAARNVKAQLYCIVFDHLRKVEGMRERDAGKKVDALMLEFEKAFT